MQVLSNEVVVKREGVVLGQYYYFLFTPQSLVQGIIAHLALTV